MTNIPPEYTYGQFVQNDVITFIPAIGTEVILPDLDKDLFDGITVKPEVLVEKYGAFGGFLVTSQLPDLNIYEVIVNTWSILQLKEKVN